jgi:hypothetical protein
VPEAELWPEQRWAIARLYEVFARYPRAVADQTAFMDGDVEWRDLERRVRALADPLDQSALPGTVARLVAQLDIWLRSDKAAGRFEAAYLADTGADGADELASVVDIIATMA